MDDLNQTLVDAKGINMDKSMKKTAMREMMSKERIMNIFANFTPKEFPTKSVATGNARKLKSGALKRRLRKNMK